MIQKKKWPQEKEELLISFLNKGNTYTEIANFFETTKNAIIGKVNRLKAQYVAGKTNLEIRVQKRKKDKEQKEIRASQREKNDGKYFFKTPSTNSTPNVFLKVDKRPFANIDRTKEPLSLNVELIELENNMCRYPDFNKDEGCAFCGHPQKVGSPYCEFHHGCCYTIGGA